MSAKCQLELESLSEDAQPLRVPLEDHTKEKQAKGSTGNFLIRGWKAVRKSIQPKNKVDHLVAEQESQVHPDTSSVEPPAGTDELEPTDEKQTKGSTDNFLIRGWKAVRKSIQPKNKVDHLVAEQESQVHPDTSSVEPPAGTDELEPTDGPSKMEQKPDTNPVDHETMMCLPGQVCEDLCVPGPSKFKKTQRADPVGPAQPPVPEPSSCDLDDKKQAKGSTDNFLIRGLKAVRKSIQTKNKVDHLVAEQESQVHPDTSSVEPPAGTDELEPTDGPSKMEQKPDTNPVDHETMMCLPGQVCEDLCVPGPSKFKKTQRADPVGPAQPPVPEPSSCDVDDKKQAKGSTDNFLIRGLKAVRKSIQTKNKVDHLVAEQESQVHPDTSSVEPPAGTDELEPTDGPSKMEQKPDTNPVDHETMMCLPGQVCEDLCVPGPSKFKKTQRADPVGPAQPHVPEPSSCDVDDKKQAKGSTGNIFIRGLNAVRKSIQPKNKVDHLVAEQESQVHPDTSSVEPPAGTDELECEPTDGPSKMEQKPDTNPVDHETMMCLPGQVCEDLCVPGPSKFKKTQHADPVGPAQPPVPEPSSCDVDDKKQAKGSTGNILIRGPKAVRKSFQTKNKVDPLVAEVHPDTSSVEPPVGTDELECEPTDEKAPEHRTESAGGIKGSTTGLFLCPRCQVPVEPTETSTGRTAQGAVEASPGNKRSKEFFECLYNVEKKIGSGGFGNVFLGTRKFDGKKVAIKRISKLENDCYLNIPGNPEPLVTEVALMLMMCRVSISPMVIQLYEWFEHPSEFTLIMEYPEHCETLKNAIYRQTWSEENICYIISQALGAVVGCIEHGVFHSDIHAKNFLINEDTKRVWLIDFGCGQLLSSEGYDSNTYRGTIAYTPPEVYTEPLFHAVPANVWSLGVLLYELSNQCLPFHNKTEITRAKVKFRNRNLSKSCKDLIRQCLARDPTKRPSLEQMLEHKWIDPFASSSSESLDSS